jgi:hypothetical protein
MSNTPEPADQPKDAAFVVNGEAGHGTQSGVDGVLGVRTYTVANSVNVALAGGPLAGFVELRSGVPYLFSAAEAAQLAAAGVTLQGPA